MIVPSYPHHPPVDEPADQTDPDAPLPVKRRSGHGWMMMVFCVPMAAIAVLLVLTGVAGGGAILWALLCMGMMAAMMLLMPGGHRHH